MPWPTKEGYVYTHNDFKVIIILYKTLSHVNALNIAVCPSRDLHCRVSLHNVEFRNHSSDLAVLIRSFEDVRGVREAEYAAPETKL